MDALADDIGGDSAGQATTLTKIAERAKTTQSKPKTQDEDSSGASADLEQEDQAKLLKLQDQKSKQEAEMRDLQAELNNKFNIDALREKKEAEIQTYVD